MKTVEELGICPMPWDVSPNIYGERDVTAKDSTLVVAHELQEMRPHDVENRRLIAATPELYVCLCDAVTDFCKDCTHKTNCHDFFIPCPAKKWRRALAKAGGEEDE